MTSDLQNVPGDAVSKFYDEFADQQTKTGINLRHYTIFQALRKAGLRKDHSVLEIGCGVGTLTTLLSSYVNRNKLVATDISEKSVEIARRNVPGSEHVTFMVSDMQDFEWNDHFDFIVLPDVLEHIPIDQHHRLFELISKVMHDRSILFIHIPHPKMIEYLHANDPAELQIVDQAVHADLLMSNAYANGLLLKDYQAYSLFSEVHDYCKITFVKNSNYAQPVPHSKMSIVARKSVRRLRYWLARI